MLKLMNSMNTAAHVVTMGEDLVTGKVVAVKFDGYRFTTATGGRCCVSWVVTTDDYEIVTGAEATYPEAFWALDAAIAKAEAAGQTVVTAGWKVWAE